MQYRGRAQAVAQEILDAFEQGRIPEALAQVFIHRETDSPCNAWSWSNRLLVALHGHHDARGFRQWKKVGRGVRKGEKSFSILVGRLKPFDQHRLGRGESLGPLEGELCRRTH
jgi:hypothetical protein